VKQIIITILCCVFISSCHTTVKITNQTLKQIPATLLGNFKDDYGSAYTITNFEWVHGKSIKYQLLQFNKTKNYFIAKNDAANPSDGGLYTRIDVMYFDNMEPWRWGFCLTAYKATTIEEAIKTAAADRENPRKGCNGYPFSRMKRE
jgi:hypothetical protein